MTNNTRSNPSWADALPLVVVSAAILIVVVAIVLLRPGQSPVAAVASQPTASPSAMASAPAATSAAEAPVAPTAVPSASPASAAPKASPRPTASPRPAATAAPTAACPAMELSGRILAWDGAAGSRIAELELRNKSAVACTVSTPTSLRLIAGDGTVLIDSAKTGGDVSAVPDQPALTVAPGASIRTDVRVSNYCGPAAKRPIGVSLSLPGAGGRVRAMPAAGVSSADALPPCNGTVGPDIQMNGWRE